VGPILRWVETRTMPSGTAPEVRRRVRDRAKLHRVVGGLLYHVPQVSIFDDAMPLQLVIPAVDQDRLLRQTHEGVLGAHVGFAKLYGLLQRRYFWRGMWTDAARFVGQCAVCKQAKARKRRSTQHGEGVMAEYPFHRVHIDIWDAGLASADGYRYVLTVVDHHTHWCELIPLKTKQATEVARAFFTGVICRHGTPAVVISDNGSEFVATLFEGLLRLYGIRHILTAPYRPQANGVAERIHGFIRPALTIMAEHDHAAWDRRVEAVAFAYRSAPVAGQEYSPFYLMHGREARLPGQLVASPVAVRPVAHADLVEQLAERLGTAFAQVTLQRQRVLQQRLERQEGQPPAATWQVGDQVLVFRPTRTGVERSAKLSFSWHGPYQVVTAGHPSYDLEHVVTGERRRAHTDDLAAAGVRPVLPSDKRPRFPAAEAPPAAGGNVSAGDMLILALPDDTEPWRLARVEEEPRPQGTCKVHYYARTEAGQSVLRATWRPEYFRPDTGEDVTSDMALPRLEAYHAMVPLSAVILSGITLTAAGRLRRSDVRRLSEVPLASWVCTRREGHQVADLPAPGARVAEEFTGRLHQGVVTRVAPPQDDEPDDAPLYYRVRFDDGDEADYTEEELRPMLRRHAASHFRHGRARDG
jgi:transposase InsO family protein